MTITHGSLFTGVGGLDLGFDKAGIETVWQCEINKQARSVLAKHWPDATRYTDVAAVKGAEVTPVDIITFGSPCQDLSVAGKRAGFQDGTRSNLYFEAIRIIKEMREKTNGEYPRYAVWENVRGALSSNGGADFLAAVEALADIGAVDIYWRVVNTCHFGPPQRRVRVFVVADFGGERAGEILSVEPRVCWHPPQIGETGTEAAGQTEDGTGSGGWTTGFSAGNSAKAGSIGYQEEMSPTIRAGASGTNQTPTIITTKTGSWTTTRDTAWAVTNHVGAGVDENFARAGHLLYTYKDISNCLSTSNQRIDYETETFVLEKEELSSALVTLNDQTLFEPENVTYRVRRLTPKECERLQGWPDDHTRWADDGKEISDSARYKMCGNGISAPVAQWLGENIVKAIEADK